MTKRILIADDHPLMLRSLRAVLESCDDFEVVGETSRGSNVPQLVEATDPDVVTLDVQLPGLDGYACLERIVDEHPNVNVVMVSALDSRRNVDRAAQLGARAYVVKTAAVSELIEVVRQAAEGAEFAVAGPTEDDDTGLTDRELAVAEAVAAGLSNKAIAEELWITEQTVKFHLTNAFRKLGVTNRIGVARAMHGRGLGRSR